MRKLVLGVVLWFLAGWTLGSFLAWAVGLPELIGPALGLAAVAGFALVAPPRSPDHQSVLGS
ncbi:MAG TPA: hypothetical protein VFX65_07710 [Candidatus Limnocylindrales bacterium]|nr:hypothetical protein [Candidatus Limnocylindrales bacterium]